MTDQSKRRFPAVHAFWARLFTRLGRSRPEPASGPASEPDIEEIGGPKGLEPTRYGDWESKGRAIDF